MTQPLTRCRAIRYEDEAVARGRPARRRRGANHPGESAMSIIRVGSNAKYADGWSQIFGSSTKKRAGAAKASGTKAAAAKKGAKKAAKKKPAAKKKRG